MRARVEHLNDAGALVSRIDTVTATDDADIPARGALVISVDDAYAEMATIADLAIERGGRITCCVTTDYLGGSGKLTAADILDLHAAGHEIATHSKTHANFTSLTAAQRVTEWDSPRSTLEALIGAPVTTFCYPYGTASSGRNATTDAEAYLRYERVLDTAVPDIAAPWPKFMPPPFLIPRSVMNGSNHEGILALVRLAAERPVIAHAYCHRLDQSVNPTTAQLVEVLDLAADLGVPIIPAREAYGTHQGLANAGFEGADLWPWRIYKTGTGAATQITDTPADGLAGTKSLSLSSGSASDYAYVRQHFPVVPGRTYTLSFRFRTISGTPTATHALGRVRGLDYAQTYLSSVASTSTAPTGSWGKAAVDYAVPQNCSMVDVDLVLNGAAAEVAFDHVWFGAKYLGDFG